MIFFFMHGHAQERIQKRMRVQDSIQVDSISINPVYFEVKTKEGTLIEPERYDINYSTGLLVLKAYEGIASDSLSITYQTYPTFLTKVYTPFDPTIIVNSEGNFDRLVRLDAPTTTNTFTPFDGLTTSGSILRGVSVGNNQNSTVNSELDLQISGKLNEKVTLRASIQDANIPNQQGGYSQNLDEFDQIFIELLSEDWNIRAGDINLQDSQSYFGQFTKKIQGLSVQGNIDHDEETQSNLFGTGAIVRGVFTQSIFTGQEGNQGPYKLTGPNGELFVLIISGSERVYVNGVQLERGETEDYIIDYNAGEIRFNSTFPITSEMRINVEYQFSERNYTRFIAYGGARFRKSEKLQLNAQVYSETDAKNQPVQQNLSPEQVAILQEAGDAMEDMIAPSAIPDTFSENKVLYRQTVIDNVEVFEFSTDPEEDLFTVRFQFVGDNQGDYIISTTNTLQRTFEYITPINGIPQGNYAPQIQLVAPTLLQLALVNGVYTPSEKTSLAFELAGSKNDLNVFSAEDDNDNTGIAIHTEATHRFFGTDSTARLEAMTNWDFIEDSFVNIEGLYNVEFNRDWNLENSLANANGTLLGTQQFITTGLRYEASQLGRLEYQFQNLSFRSYYNGVRHSVQYLKNSGKLRTTINGSTLNANDIRLDSDFSRVGAVTTYGFKKGWIGAKFYAEDRLKVLKENDSITPDSQRFQMYEASTGVGDSTKIFAAVGYRFRVNDSLQNNRIERVNQSNTYFLNSQLVKTVKTNLSVFLNYRTLTYTDPTTETENSLNARLLYNQQLGGNFIRLNTVFETNSGTQPQQEFTFVNVDEGQGTHTWNDYNNDGVQQLEEFEIAQFQDQADFVRVLLPNRVFVKTHQNRFSQQVILNPQQWSGTSGLKKALSRFYNQTSYVIDKRNLREGAIFDLNPFGNNEETIGLAVNFRNALTFNRGKQRYTTTYTYLSTSANTLLFTGLQENELESHQLTFLHKIKSSWLFNFQNKLGSTSSRAENFPTRNFQIENYSINPKISYLFDLQSRVSLFYSYQQKENQIGMQESLKQQNFGTSFAYTTGEKLSLIGEFKYIDNRFRESGSITANAFSPVAYQLLEGLQPGTNFTWNLIAQRRLTKFLDLNISYFGRKSEGTRTIHTGNVQLRAFF